MLPVTTTLAVAAATARNIPSFGSGSFRRPRSNRRYSTTEFIDGCQQNIDATRWQRQLGSPEYLLVLSTNRLVEYELQVSSESGFDDATRWPRSGEQTGNEAFVSRTICVPALNGAVNDVCG